MKGLSREGREFLRTAMETAEDLWRMRRLKGALDVLYSATRDFPRYEPAYRFMLRIMREEKFHSRDVLWVLRKIEGIGKLGPKGRLEMGMEEFTADGFDKALPLLEQALSQPPELIGEWGYDPEIVGARAQVCQMRLEAMREARAGAQGLRKAKREARIRKPSGVEAPLEEKGGEPEREGGTGPEEETPRVRVRASVEDASAIIGEISSGQVSGLSRYRLGDDAFDLARAESYESLLCIPHLRGVDRYEYQVEAVRRVLRSFRGRVLLADEVGLGKTIEAGMVIKEYRMRGMVRKVLVLSPPALVGQWCEELETKFGLAPASTGEAGARRDPEGFWKGHDLIVASLAMARNERHGSVLRRTGFDLVVVDEAHHLKNHRTASYRLVNELKSRFLLLLTATPVQNSLMDLYNLVTLLRPGQLGTRASFRRGFVLRGDPTMPQNRARLRELVGELMIRNTRALADVRLPSRHASTVVVEGSAAERELYGRLVELVREGYPDERNRLAFGLLLQEAGSSPRAVRRTLLKMAGREGAAAALRERMISLAGLCERVGETAKTARLLELLRAGREKTLVFSRFNATLDEIAYRLERAGVEFSAFTGRMSAREKDAAVAAFRDGARVMLCSEIGGEGRNLQFCSTMVNFDLPWNPMRIEQRIGRIHRIGQERMVHVFNLCSRGTAEDRILEVLDRRINMFELVVGEIDMIIGHMKDEREFSERVLAIYGESRDEGGVKDGFNRLGGEMASASRRYEKVKRLDSEIFSGDYGV